MQEIPHQVRGELNKEIDLAEVAGHLWKGRKTLIIAMVLCFLLGFGWYLYRRLATPPLYESEVLLLVESSSIADGLFMTQPEDNADGRVIISMVADSIPAGLYPLMITSAPFLGPLLQVGVNDPAAGGPVILSGLLNAVAPGSDPIALLKNGLSVEPETPRTLRIKLTLPRTTAVTAITDSLAARLSSYLIGMASHKASRNLQFILQLQTQATAEAEKALKEIAGFHEGKSKPLLDNKSLEEKRLQANWKIAYERQVFLSREAEKARYRLQAATPSVTVIQPASAAKRTKLPNLMLILLASVLTGFIIGSGILFLKKEAE